MSIRNVDHVERWREEDGIWEKEREQASNTGRRRWLEGGCEGKKDEFRDEERWAAGKDDERQRERESERGELSPGSGEGFCMGMHDARSEITGFAEPAIMAL